MGCKQGESKCSSRPEQHPLHRGPARACLGRRQHRQLLQGAAGSPSISCLTSPSFNTPVTLPASQGLSRQQRHGVSRWDQGFPVSPPACAAAAAPRQGTGRFFPAFPGAGFSGFNYICGLDRFAWPLKSISQRVVLKRARNICGGCGFPPGLQEE